MTKLNVLNLELQQPNPLFPLPPPPPPPHTHTHTHPLTKFTLRRLDGFLPLLTRETIVVTSYLVLCTPNPFERILLYKEKKSFFSKGDKQVYPELSLLKLSIPFQCENKCCMTTNHLNTHTTCKYLTHLCVDPSTSLFGQANFQFIGLF